MKGRPGIHLRKYLESIALSGGEGGPFGYDINCARRRL
jgi:hypothetical protein